MHSGSVSAVISSGLPALYVVPSVINVRAAMAAILRKLPIGGRAFVFQVRSRWSQIGDTSPIGWSLTSLRDAKRA